MNHFTFSNEIAFIEFCPTVNDYFGFGLMNAEAMVNLALSWQPVSDQTVCRSGIISLYG